MKLLYQTHSPYARKVLVFAHEAGLADRLAVVHHETSPVRPNAEVRALNPLGTVPVLIAEGGAIFDSDVICDYLDRLHDGPRLIPADGIRRWRALRLQALAQGLAAAGIALRWETERRPAAVRWPPMQDGQAAKLAAAYDFLEGEVPDGPVDIGQIALATALGWIEFRRLPMPEARHPRLRAWFAAFATRPSMVATAMSGDTHD